MTRLVLSVLVFFLIAMSCRKTEGMPKPRAYPRIEYPERKYLDYLSADCPFTFQYPTYAQISYKDEACWFDLFMPDFAAKIHCSYLSINKKEEFEDLVKDAFVIASRINERANYMEESRVKNEQEVNGLILQFSGPAASPIHFFLTDSTQHFFKAALYFDSKVQPDSLAPIVEFIRKDIDHMISTFNWGK